MTVSSRVQTFDWDDILDALENEKCILFLGPGTYRVENGNTLESALYEELDVLNPDHQYIRNFYQDDGFFLFREDFYKRRVIRRIREFYEKPHPSTQPLLEKLAQIPFHIAFTLTPDRLLAKAFDEKGLAYHHDFYFKNHPPQDYIAPTATSPLLYNMLGFIEEYDSLVLTHNDLFDYLGSIFAQKSMQPELREQLRNAHSFIFLGLPFEKWYLQLLLRVLYLHHPDLGRLERYASQPNAKVREELKNLFEDQFHIEFIPNDPSNFIEELYLKCDEKAILKVVTEKRTDTQSVKQQLREAQDLLRNYKIVKGVSLLRSVLEAIHPTCRELLEKLDFHEAIFRKLTNKEKEGLATADDQVEIKKTVRMFFDLHSDITTCLER